MPSLSVPTENTETQYSIDKELYDSAIAIRDEMNLVSERLAKMEELKKEVSEAVYLRVQSDYLAKFEHVKKSFDEKKQEIQKALIDLYKKQRERETELQKHKEVLEEAKFRNFLGEYTDKKFKEVDNRESAEIKRLEKIISTIQSNAKQYEDLVGGPVQESEIAAAPVVEEAEEDEGEEPPPVVEPIPSAKTGPVPVTRIPKAEEPPPLKEVKEAKVEKQPPPSPKMEEPEEEIDYFLEEEGDYFQAEEGTAAPESTPPVPVPKSKAVPVSPTPPEKLKTEKVRPLKSTQPQEEVPTSPDALGKKPEQKTEEAPKAAPKSGGMAFDDSISSILRSIPLEEEEKEESPAPEVVEEAPEGAQDAEAIQDAEALLGFTEEEEEQPSTTQAEGKQLKAKLICIEGELNPSEIELTENISIGRSPSNDIVLKEAKVSRQHAAINLIKGKYILVDLKSSNGVFVNGQKIEEHALQDEDEISIGSFRMVYRSS